MGKKIKKFIVTLIAIVLTVFALSSSALRLYTVCFDNADKIGVAAAGLVLTEGEVSRPSEKADTKADTEIEDTFNTVNIDTDTTEHAGEQIFPIIESKYTASGTGYDNFYVKNTTCQNINIGELLNAKLEFKAEDTTEPQVLIVHTHTSESYMDTDAGFYYESYTARSKDDSKNVVSVGNSITQKLKSMGIGVVHDTTHYDDPGYNGSYDRSMEGIQKYLKEYNSIKVVLDIHRDALITSDEAIIKPTFTVNGKKAAQIMIMSGCDSDGSRGFSFWNENLKFALKLQSKAETLYPGMTRPLYFGDFVYNMNANSGSLLIEVGTHANTLDEAVYTGELLSNVLAQVLREG